MLFITEEVGKSGQRWERSDKSDKFFLILVLCRLGDLCPVEAKLFNFLGVCDLY